MENTLRQLSGNLAKIEANLKELNKSKVYTDAEYLEAKTNLDEIFFQMVLKTDFERFHTLCTTK